MSAKRDYYEVLGVDRKAPADEIKKQYRKLALKFHPARNNTAAATEHLKEISEAYAVLSDDAKRQLYDRHGHEGVDGRYSREDIFAGAQGNFDEVFGRAGDFESIFENIFGGRAGGRGGDFGTKRGADRMYETTVTLEEVLRGKQIDTEIKKRITCTDCRGSGCNPGTGKNRCRACGGLGQIKQTRRMGFAAFVTAMPCSACRGQGVIVESPCSACKGQGNKKGKKFCSFKVPPGVTTGDYIIQGEGDEVPDGENGDLILRVRVKEHELFERDGKNIHILLPISIVDAALGRTIDIPTLDGKTTVKISSGSQPDTIIKVKGRGVPHIQQGGGRGDMHVHLVVTVPKKLNRTQRNLLEEFQRESNR